MGGMFVALEGPDCVGKTTQLAILKDRLEGLDGPVVVVHEPGGTPENQKIRQLIFDGFGKHQPVTEALLFLAAKAQLQAQVIRPALEARRVVLSDRYTDSLLAYQGVGQQLGISFLMNLVQSAGLDLYPTFTIYLQAPFEVCMARLVERGRNGEEVNAIDNASVDFHRRVHDGYQELVRQAIRSKKPHVVINAWQDPSLVAQDIWNALVPEFRKREQTVRPVILRD